MLSAAESLYPELGRGTGPVGIACAQPGWVLAGLLAAWGARRAPILLDPSLRKETDSLRRLHPRVEVFADRGDPADGRVLVREPEGGNAGGAPSWLVLPGDDDLFACLFTSGSEGDNKVVEKRGRQIYRQCAALLGLLGFPRGGRVLSFVPPYHLLGFVYGVVLPMVAEGDTVIATELTGGAMVQLVEKYAPRLVVGTATHYRFLARAAKASVPAPTTVYLSSGAPLDPTTAEAFAQRFGTAVRDFYGSTELGGVAWRTWPDAYRPMPGIDWRLAPGTGRLEVRSPWGGAPEDAWVPTDDAAEAVGDGFKLLGRLSHMVKVGGKRFSSVEVEQALRAMPSVAEVAVLPFERFGEGAIAAFVVAEPAGAVSEEGVRAFLSQRLAPFKLPRTIRVIERMPRGSHEKVDYAALRALLERA